MPKHAGGRPPKIKADIDDAVANALASKGFTDEEIASLYNVSRQTVDNWKKKYPSFFASLKDGKDIADKAVEVSLFKRARGYSHPDVNITNYKGRAIITPIIKHYPPDPTSMIFWLKNRKKEEWRDKLDHEHSGKDGEPLVFSIGVMSKEAQARIDTLRNKLTGKTK